MTATNEPEKNIPPWLEISQHPKYWDGQLFPESELLLMGEGDYDARIDEDRSKMYEPQDNQQSHH